MFTGIIESMASVMEKNPQGLSIERPKSFDDLKIGSSVCVSGVCLSIVELTPSSMRFDVIPETISKTTLGSLKKGDRVNLERAMKMGDRMDGHVVQGHVETAGEVDRVQRTEDRGMLVIVRCPLSVVRFALAKGSIAIDGVSLTIAKIQGDQITVALIPHTLENTTLGSLKKGDQVNIETDVMVRTAQKRYSSESYAH